MGVEIEYSIQNKITGKMSFADHGGIMWEHYRDSRVRLLTVSNLEGNKGTVFIMGDTKKVKLTEYQDICDLKGSSLEAKLIDNARVDVGVYVEIKGDHELSIAIEGEKEQNSMRIFLCDFSHILAERIPSQKT